MDKRLVIAAYKRGFITIQECAQIIGVDSRHVTGLMNDPKLAADTALLRKGHTVNNL